MSLLRRSLGAARRSSKTTAPALLALLVAVAGAGAAMKPSGDGGRVRACVDRSDGEMHEATGAHCPGESYVVAWDAQPPAGPTGAAGATGHKGVTGTTGRRGATGPAGTTGATGGRGEAGADGAPGATGERGPSGGVGPQGPRGLAGETGATGPRGATGPDGAPGATGGAGAPGEAGERGPRGRTGAAGPTGPASLAEAELATGSINYFTSTSGNHESVTATCAPGKKVTGGGAYSSELAAWIQTEGPTAGEGGWNVTYVIRPGFAEGGKNARIMAVAYCSAR